MRFIVAVTLPLFLVIAGCSPSRQERDASAPPPPVMDLTAEAGAWADSIVDLMTLKEQAAQLLMPATYARADAATMLQIREYAEEMGIGALLLLAGDAESAAAIADSLEAMRDRSRIKAGVIMAVDAETGLGMRFSDAPLFPWNSRIHRGVEDQTFYDYGREVGREARLTGINMVLGPVVDVDRSPSSSGVMKLRSLGSDQLRVAELALAYAAGIESQGVMSVAKHFPGHGPTATDSHTGLPMIDAERRQLDSIDLVPFRSYIANGLTGIMVGHIWASALDSVRRPASFSPLVIDSLLRKEMEFKGLVLVDAMAMGGAKGHTAADAIAAGADMIIAPEDTRQALASILQAVETGRIGPDQLREHARCVLFYKYLFHIPFSSRRNLRLTSDQLKERLQEEALPILDSLLKP